MNNKRAYSIVIATALFLILYGLTMLTNKKAECSTCLQPAVQCGENLAHGCGVICEKGCYSTPASCNGLNPFYTPVNGSCVCVSSTTDGPEYRSCETFIQRGTCPDGSLIYGCEIACRWSWPQCTEPYCKQTIFPGDPVDAQCWCVDWPTNIELQTFVAEAGVSVVTLFWETGSEIDNAGFNIYRSESENGNYSKINSSLIPAQGSSTQGASYEFTDTNVKNRTTHFYKLEDIDLNGTATMHGPVSATPRLIFGILGK
ncbi:MAG: hypothetical protein NTV89_17730 [Proteobacteria bacterium]|nr:hypothetical protein [Pseudomonadota bacterium]